MTLYKDMLTKSLKRSRKTALTLLQQLSRAGGIPEPVFEHEVGGTAKRPSHYARVRFRVPSFLHDPSMIYSSVVVGSGRCSKKVDAKSLAALEVIFRLENDLQVKEGFIATKLEEFIASQKQKQEEIEALPVSQQIPGVSWETVPMDMCFGETSPAGRRDRIEFFPSLTLKHSEAFMAAKAITLTSREGLPIISVHQNNTSEANQCYANIRVNGHIEGVSGARRDEMYGVESSEEAALHAFERIADNIRRRARRESFFRTIASVCERKDSSFGMAKLFVSLPKHQFQDLKLLLEKIQKHTPSSGSPIDSLQQQQRNKEFPKNSLTRKNEPTHDDVSFFRSRLDSFRSHQKTLPLPVDSVEADIPHDAMVTIVQGGTGSGKTTRYPLMLSLFSPTGPSTKIVVVQPRRLACQTAANRVAMEQGFVVGSKDCPIGYAIRFESRLSSTTMGRTVDFCTPGVLLRCAADDPDLSSVTHLVIDEIHERNADVDLLLALAKQVMQKRAQHATLQPLRLILMSATLDWSRWEAYFKLKDPSITVELVNLPDVRRFPITTVHLEEKGFPLDDKWAKRLQRVRHGNHREYDEVLCEATAELATKLFFRTGNDTDTDGSILCFVPGMEEIRRVQRHIDTLSRKFGAPNVLWLHSSLTLQEQAKVFKPGKKIILSTNIAETSVTIPDVKFVIDAGRERQSNLLDSDPDFDNVSVIGSQLVTVNISQASAKQRAGRAGRVSAGTCYRLYTLDDLESKFDEFAIPEMLRMELSQLVLHSISFYHSISGHPLSLLLDSPDPPSESRLRQALYELAFQGLVDITSADESSHFQSSVVENLTKPIQLTPLGIAVCNMQVSPILGRMLFLGLVLRAIGPALSIAALLSVPQVFSNSPGSTSKNNNLYCSDVVFQLSEYEKFKEAQQRRGAYHPKSALYNQVTRIRGQLEQALTKFMGVDGSQGTDWNENGNRVAAQVGLICAATPNIAHLVSGRSGFSTRNVISTARMHPSSVNFDNDRRAHWYVYHELRATSEAYLQVTTAVSPLDLAIFASASSTQNPGTVAINVYSDLGDMGKNADWLFIADQWVPVAVLASSQSNAFRLLRRWITYEMLQQVALDASKFSQNEDYNQIVLFTLSALEQQRLPK